MKNIVQRFLPFIKYCFVGGLSTLIDLGFLYVFVEYLKIPPVLASVCSFLLSAINSFLLNKIWTFQNTSSNYRKLFIKFLMVSVVGLGLTVICMSILLSFLPHSWYLLAKALTSGIVLIWNFLGNKLWTFKVHPKKVLHSPKTFPFELSIVIPAYNEEKRLEKTLAAVEDYLQRTHMNAEIIVVDDGSKDKTLEVAEKFKQRHGKNDSKNSFHVLSLGKNQGKGAAVKKGVEVSQGRYILFTDADNSTPIEEVAKLLKTLQEDKVQIAIGSRYLPTSKVEIKQPGYRIAMGRIGNFLISFFLIEGIRDTQCGFKLFESVVAKQIFSLQKIKKFAFDMEILVIAKSLGYKIQEVPVSWYNSPESRVRPIKDGIVTLKDLFYIKLNLLSGRYRNEVEVE